MKNLKILIVEDDKSSEILLSILIEKYSKEILIAHTGLQAIEMFINNPDIDLIFMDIRIPIMDGYEAIRRIKKINQNVIIFAQSANEYNTIEKIIDCGCNEFIQKPYRNNLINKLIEKYFS